MLHLQETRARGLGRVVEVGPGTCPFSIATEFIGWSVLECPPGKRFYELDINIDRFPFEDNSIDFIYCRHTLEDLYNPFHACREMSRVAKAGYIETPSPIAEVCRGVDGSGPRSRGYIHHRHIIWENDGLLTFLPKLPIIEYVEFGDDEEKMVSLLNLGPLHWNTYFPWQDRINFRDLQHDRDFDIMKDYVRLLSEGMSKSLRSHQWITQLVIASQTTVDPQ